MSSFGYKKLDGNTDYGSIPPPSTTLGQGAYPTGPPVAHPTGPPSAPAPGMYSGGSLPEVSIAPSSSSVVNAPYPAGVAATGYNGPPEGGMSVPSAPPPTMEPLAGYEDVGFTVSDFLAPPTPFMSAAPSAPPIERPEFSIGPTWTDEEVRDALLEYVSHFCCYGSGTAKNMVITDKIGTSAYHYRLETFGEGRQVNWTFKPYAMGTFVDGPENGRALGPWEIPVHITEYFKDFTQKLEIPHTSFVRPCHTCSTAGMVICQSCFGKGRKLCSHCHGTGHRHVGSERRNCMFCHGHKTVLCKTCHGKCFVICPSCEANRNLRFYLELTIQWKNHVEDYIFSENSLPPNLIKDVSGTTAFEETHLRVWPINHFMIPQINQASYNLINKHGSAFPTERILQQKQTIRIVPVLEVEYNWNNKKSDFFVYGLEKKVHAPKYPQKCCCGCTIL